MDKHPNERTSACLQNLTLPIFGPAAALRETRRVMTHIYQNKSLLETLMMRRVVGEDEFVYQEARRVIDELSSYVNSATIAFRLGISEEDFAENDATGGTVEEISQRIAFRTGGDVAEIAGRIQANNEKRAA